MMALTRKKVLSLAVCACCQEAGFQNAENSVIETLTTMLQSLIIEIGRASQIFAEHNGRTEVTMHDIQLALIDLGLNITSIAEYAKRRNIIRIPSPTIEPQAKSADILPAGQKRPLHSHIPDYYPPFPDPHSYIRTPTIKQPITEYEVIRDKAACQKRDLEKALTKFVAKTHPSPPEHSLFGSNAALNKLFPLISIQKSKTPFLDGLLHKDQVWTSDD